MRQESRAARVERLLRERFGVRVVAAEDGGVLLLSGRVPSEAVRATAERLATREASGARLCSLLEVERVLPDDRVVAQRGELEEQPLFEGGSPEALFGHEVNPRFTGQPLETNTLAVEGASVFDQCAVEPDPVFFPPTDPVTRGDAARHLEVVGGFAPTAMDDIVVAASAEDNSPSDAALEEAVTRELHDDALTTDLRIEAVVERDVARLRGSVPELEDAGNAESAASRIPGVREVVDELDVAQL